MEGPSSCVFAWGPAAVGQKKLVVTGSAAGSEFSAQDIFTAPTGPSSPTNKKSLIIIHEAKIETGKLEKRAQLDVGSNRLERVKWVKSSHASAGANGLIIGQVSDGTVQVFSAEAMLANGLKEAAPAAPTPKPAEGAEGAAKPKPAPALRNPLLCTIRHPRGAVVTFDVSPNGAQVALAGPEAVLSVWNLEDPKKPTEAPLEHPANPAANLKASDIQYNPTRPEILAVSTHQGTVQLWTLTKPGKLWSQIQASGMVGFTCVAWSPVNPGELVVGTESSMHAGGMRGPPCAIQLWDFNRPGYDRLTRPKSVMDERHFGGIKSLSWSKLDPTMLVATDTDGQVLLWDPQECKFIAELPHKGGGKLSVAWHPSMPLLASAAAIEGRLLVSSMHALPKGSAAPGWLKRPCGFTFGFGGRMAGHSSKSNHGEHVNTNVRLLQSSNDESPFAARAVEFAAALASEEADALTTLCAARAKLAKERGERDAHTIWSLMSRLLVEEVHVAVRSHLGFEEASLADAEDNVPQTKADDMARRCFLAGDTGRAHQWLLAGNRVADALVFSHVSNGFPEAMARYYANASKAAPPPSAALVSLVRCYVEGASAVQELIAGLGQKDARLTWKELLAISACVGQAEQQTLYDALADVIEQEKEGDSVLCWIAAGNVGKILDHMVSKVDKRKPEQLEQIVEMAQILGKVYGVAVGTEAYWDLQYRYASLLGGQGMLAAWEATKLLVNCDHMPSIELRWRLVNSYWPDSGINPTQPYESFAFQYVAEPVPVVQEEVWPAQPAAAAHQPVHHTQPAHHQHAAPAVHHTQPAAHHAAHQPVAAAHHTAHQPVAAAHHHHHHPHHHQPAQPAAAHGATNFPHGGRQQPLTANPVVKPANLYSQDDTAVYQKMAGAYQKMYSHALSHEEFELSKRVHASITELLNRIAHRKLSEACRTDVLQMCRAPEYFDEWLGHVQQTHWQEYQSFAEISHLRDAWPHC